MEEKNESITGLVTTSTKLGGTRIVNDWECRISNDPQCPKLIAYYVRRNEETRHGMLIGGGQANYKFTRDRITKQCDCYFLLTNYNSIFLEKFSVMKFSFVPLLIIAATAAVGSVAAHEEAECDCRAQIEEQVRPIMEQRDTHHRDVETLLQQREQLIRERDEHFQHKETLLKERDELIQQKEHSGSNSGALQTQLDDTKRMLDEHRVALDDTVAQKNELQQEMESLKETVARSAEDREHFQKVAQENQHYMQEYKVRLATMRDRSAKLDIELENARTKIAELESATLVTKVKKELAAGYDSLLQLMGKHPKDGEPDDL